MAKEFGKMSLEQQALRVRRGERTAKPGLKEIINHGSIDEINQAFENILIETSDQFPNLSPFEFYIQLARRIPMISPEKQREALVQIKSGGGSASERGMNVYFLSSIGTIINAVSGFATDNEDLNSDIFQAAAEGVVAGVASHEVKRTISIKVYDDALRSIRRYLRNRRRYECGAELESDPVTDEVYKEVYEKAMVESVRESDLLTEGQFHAILGRDVLGIKSYRELGEFFGVKQSTIRNQYDAAWERLKEPMYANKLEDLKEFYKVSDASRIIHFPSNNSPESEKESSWSKWVREHPLPKNSPKAEERERYRRFIKALDGGRI